MDVVGVVHREASIFGVSFPELPGCVSAGDSLADMLVMAAEALSMHLETMVDDGEPLPAFRSLVELETDPSLQAYFAGSEYAVIFSVGRDGRSVSVQPKSGPVPLAQRHDAAE